MSQKGSSGSSGNRTRDDGRSSDALRPVAIETGVQRFPEGSVLYACGGTKILVSASVEDGVRDFLRGTGNGWVTAEYMMHPRSNPRRQRREGHNGKIGGRTQEIQRLVGRSLRAAVRLDMLGERNITIDCDVLDADGGTRTASITGGYIALVIALDGLRRKGLVKPGVLRENVAAVSVGLVEDKVLLDLCYTEDSAAQVDLNLVATGSGALVEVQGTAEGAPMRREQHDALIDCAMAGVADLCTAQNAALREVGIDVDRLLG